MKVHIKKLWTCKVIKLIISQFWDPRYTGIIGILSFYNNPYHHLHNTLLRRQWWFDLLEFGWRYVLQVQIAMAFHAPFWFQFARIAFFWAFCKLISPWAFFIKFFLIPSWSSHVFFLCENKKTCFRFVMDINMVLYSCIYHFTYLRVHHKLSWLMFLVSKFSCMISFYFYDLNSNFLVFRCFILLVLHFVNLYVEMSLL